MGTMRLRLTLLTLPLVSAMTLACDVESSDDVAPLRETPHTRPNDAAPADEAIDLDDPAQRSTVLPGAVWIDYTESAITPWCAGVLVAPDVVITAARCIESPSAARFKVGVGDIESKRYDVAEIVLQDDSTDPDPDHALAALRLEIPVRGVEPVDLSMGREDVCDVTSVANLFVVRGDPGGRWLWRGCVEDGELTAQEGSAPNCHGDMGAGAFLQDGALLGIAVDAWSDGGCAVGHRLAGVADNEKFFDRAMELSTPAA